MKETLVIEPFENVDLDHSFGYMSKHGLLPVPVKYQNVIYSENERTNRKAR